MGELKLLQNKTRVELVGLNVYSLYIKLHHYCSAVLSF
jgi:hypothetical protein